MIKILKQGKVRTVKRIPKKVKCPRCKCKFSFEFGDCYKALSVLQVLNYYVDCPCCKKSIYLFDACV